MTMAAVALENDCVVTLHLPIVYISRCLLRIYIRSRL